MSFECSECGSEVIKSICPVCEYAIFSIPINVTQRCNDSDYLELIQHLVKKTNLKEQVIENLIAFEQLSIISDIIVEFNHSFNQVVISVPSDIHDTTYQQHPFFIFSNFNLYNTKFSVKHINIEHVEIIPVFNNNFSQKKQYLELQLKPFKKPKINISLQYKLEDTIPYDTSLLNQEESEELYSNIEEQIEQYDIVSWSENDQENNSFFEKTVAIDWSQELNIILQNIQSEIDIFQDDVDSIIEELKQINKSIFERALLEKELKFF